MGNEPATVQETEFVFRRLSEAFHLGSKEYSGYLWLAILIPLLLLGIVYVIWMYVRDGRGIGWPWATFLAGLRLAVYFILAAVFLLPGFQTWDKSETRSKVVVLFDVSGSMASKDDLPTEALPVEKLLSREDKVIRFLTNDQVAFLKRLSDLNPVTMYRFGSQVDEEFKLHDDQKPWSEQEWNEWLKPDPRKEMPGDLDEQQKAEFRKKLELNAQLVYGTNLGESLLAVLNREANNMLQGIIVVSDGRSSQFSSATFDAARDRALRAKVPVFAIAVGEYRQPISIQITDLQAPDHTPPDDKFPVRVDIDGYGLADRPVEVALDVTRPNGETFTLAPNVKPGEAVKFKPGEPPHAQVEFEVDKPEMEGDWKLVARVPKDKREAFVPKEHVTEPAIVHVVKKPLRVLLFASAPTREYQFVRSLFVRESDQRRAEVSIYLQLARPDIVQDVPAERLLRRFPSRLGPEDDPKETAEEKYDNLNQYDVVIGFDPDWTQLTPDQMETLRRWVADGGGLILGGGPVNTFQLARGVNYEKVRTVLDLYPVIPDDSRRQATDRPSTEPWRLNFPGATNEMEFLKLDEDVKEPLAGWEEFFTGNPTRGSGEKDAKISRGFYNFYPVRMVKPTASVVATFSDPRARLTEGGEQPFLVIMPYPSGRVVYLSSGEMWRLRQYREAFHERFWTKLARYAGAAKRSGAKAHALIVMGKVFTANNFVRLEARLRGRDMMPLPRTEKPRIQLKPPQGVTMPTTVELQPKPGQAADWDGWFAARFLVNAPGNYELQLQVPGTTEVQTNKFLVKESNPELDNTRPDFDQLRQMASPASARSGESGTVDVLQRVGDDDKRSRVVSELERTNKVPVRPKDASEEDKDSLRLFFDLKAAELIPECMKTESKTRRSLGSVHDLWDDGFVIQQGEPPLRVSYALLIIIGLLSIEWLTRKLIKLA